MSMLVTANKFQVVADAIDRREPAQLAERFLGESDWVLAKGFSLAPCDKIEILRRECGKPPRCTINDSLIAIVTDMDEVYPRLPHFALDDIAGLAEFLKQGLGFDVLLLSGGSSVGVHDHVKTTLEPLGVSIHFWRVEMRPGHPVTFGTDADERIVFGPPGNPVSGMVCFEQFVLPALRRMMGHSRAFQRTVEARLTHPGKIRPGRTEFVRVILTREKAGELSGDINRHETSGALRSMAQADGLLVVPASSSGLAAGELGIVQHLDGTSYQSDANLEKKV